MTQEVPLPPTSQEQKSSILAKVLLALVLAVAVLLLAGLVLVLMWRRNADNELERLVSGIQAQNQPLTLEELQAWYPDPEGQNAADVLEQARLALDDRSEHANAVADLLAQIDEYHDQPAVPEELLGKARIELRALEPVLEHIRRTDNMDSARFPIDLTLGHAVELPHLGAMRSMTRILNVAAEEAAARGAYDEATAHIMRGLRLSQFLENEPVLISQLVAIAIRGIMSDSLTKQLSRHQWPIEHLVALQEQCSQLQGKEGLRRSMIGERTTAYCLMRAIYFDGESANILDVADAWESTRQLPPFVRHILGNNELRGWLAYFEPLLTTVEAPWPELLEATSDAPRGGWPRFTVVSPILAPALGRSTIAFARDAATLRSMRIALAIERFKSDNARLPENLEELVPTYLEAVPPDPFDGAPMRYKILDDSYVIYSVFDDRIDDGGEPYTKPEDHTFEGDWVFRIYQHDSATAEN